MSPMIKKAKKIASKPRRTASTWRSTVRACQESVGSVLEGNDIIREKTIPKAQDKRADPKKILSLQSKSFPPNLSGGLSGYFKLSSSQVYGDYIEVFHGRFMVFYCRIY